MQQLDMGGHLAGLRSSGLRWLGQGLGVVVYMAVVAYGEVRNYTLLRATVDPELLPLALIGIVALGLTALALPLVIHHGSEPGPHRTAAVCFFLIDLGVLAINAVLDAGEHAGAVSSWLQLWAIYVVPAMPLVVGGGWSILWLLDPGQRDRDLVAQVRAAARLAFAQQVISEASSPEVNAEVTAAARVLARQIAGELGGPAVSADGARSRRLDAGSSVPNYENAKEFLGAQAVAPARNGRNGNGKHP